MFALSTAWNADRLEDGRKIAEEIYSLGFRSIELNFSLTAAMVEEIAQFASANNLSIQSLHNYCPIPEDMKRSDALPDCFSLSSLDESERKKAVEHTKNTISTAKRLKARAVVLHAGRVEIPDKTRTLIELYNCGQFKSQTFEEIKEAFVKERLSKKKDNFAQILKSLEVLSAYALQSGIVLGIENRFYFREIPSIDEFAILFKKFGSKNVAYWHDVGHSYIMEQLGLIKEGELLKNYGKNLLGIHLHNIKNLVDHQAPINGDFDFRILAPYMKPHVLKVIEAHSSASAQEIQDSVKFLEGVGHD